jgi:hypothetical protein
MHLGRYLAGDVLPLVLLAKNSAKTPAKPTTAPAYTVYNAAGTAVATGAFPLWNSLVQAGLFRLLLRLNATFPAGRYDVIVSYAISGVTVAQQFRFEVVAGGHVDGNIISLARLDTANRWLVAQKDSGKLDAYRNARMR